MAAQLNEFGLAALMTTVVPETSHADAIGFAPCDDAIQSGALYACVIVNAHEVELDIRQAPA